MADKHGDLVDFCVIAAIFIVIASLIWLTGVDHRACRKAGYLFDYRYNGKLYCYGKPQTPEQLGAVPVN